MLYIPKDSGLRIQKLRRQSGMTQEQLAGKVNISTSTLGKIERGIQSPSIDLMVELSSLFGVHRAIQSHCGGNHGAER